MNGFYFLKGEAVPEICGLSSCMRYKNPKDKIHSFTPSQQGYGGHARCHCLSNISPFFKWVLPVFAAGVSQLEEANRELNTAL